MLRRALLLAVPVPLLLFIGTFVASAHEIQRSGPISVLLHTDPDDAPVAGEQATLSFAIGQQGQDFQLEHCLCQVTIKEGDTVLTTAPLTPVDPEDGQLLFTFPQKDTYAITISGKPDSTVQFAPFDLTYNIRVDQAVSDPRPLATPAPAKSGISRLSYVALALLGILSLGSLGYLVYSVLSRRKVAVDQGDEPTTISL